MDRSVFNVVLKSLDRPVEMGDHVEADHSPPLQGQGLRNGSPRTRTLQTSALSGVATPPDYMPGDRLVPNEQPLFFDGSVWRQPCYDPPNRRLNGVDDLERAILTHLRANDPEVLEERYELGRRP